MKWDTEYKLQQFRESEEQYFDKESGAAYENAYLSAELTRERELILALEKELRFLEMQQQSIRVIINTVLP